MGVLFFPFPLFFSYFLFFGGRQAEPLACLVRQPQFRTIHCAHHFVFGIAAATGEAVQNSRTQRSTDTCNAGNLVIGILG